MKMAIRRGIVVIVGIFLQLTLSLSIYLFFIEHVALINTFFTIFSFLVMLGLIKNSKNYSYSLPLIIILILFPIMGILFIIFFYNNKSRSRTLKSIKQSENDSKKYLIQDKEIREEFKDNGKLRYISDFSGYPVTKNNDVNYYKVGEEAFDVMLEELKKAEKFIFCEYFIVANGKMWSSILV